LKNAARILLACLVCGPLRPAWADGFSAVASVSSSYPYRGYSKSDNSPTARLNLDYGHSSGGFAGVWVARVDFGDQGYRDRSNVEIYPYLGYGFKLAEGWRLEFAAARYVFDGRIFGKFSDYNEYRAGLHVSDWLTAKVDFADDGYHRGGAILGGEVSGRYPVTANLAASAGLAYNHIDVSLAESALYWNLGLTWYYQFAALDVRYVDAVELPTPSARHYGPSLPDLKQNFVVSLSVGF
jgi:uncharacterized protein (TIGR02001 family)